MRKKCALEEHGDIQGARRCLEENVALAVLRELVAAKGKIDRETYRCAVRSCEIGKENKKFAIELRSREGEIEKE